MWYLDSGCSRHIMDDKMQFIILESKEGRVVIFSDNGKGYIIGIGNICITLSTYIENILLIDGLKLNLLSISQLYDKKFEVNFESLIYIVTSPIDNGIILIRHRYQNIYMVDLDDHSIKNGRCLVAINAKINENSWL